MTTRILLAATIVSSLTASAIAQTAPVEHRHHYQGGPQTVIPHDTQSPATAGKARSSADKKAKTKNEHGYSGGPQTVVPHTR